MLIRQVIELAKMDNWDSAIDLFAQVVKSIEKSEDFELKTQLGRTVKK